MRKTNKLLAKKGGDAIKPGALVSAVDNYKPDEDSLAVIEQVINTTNIDEMNARGETPLYLATMYNYPAEIAEMLIEKGANVNIVRETDKTTPLHNAINKENVDTVKLLLGSDANVNQIYGRDDLRIFCNDTLFFHNPTNGLFLFQKHRATTHKKMANLIHFHTYWLN